jgi:putative tryptophan/tyrosine transport system permease protein
VRRPLNQVAFFGALEIGLIYGLVALGVFLSFRVLSFPDLTVDGSFPLGAAVAASAIVAGVDPYVATLLAIVAGALAGLVTALLNVRFRILHLLASILTMIALFSINLRIMGRPNIALIAEPTVLTPFEGLGVPAMLLKPLVVGVLLAAVVALLAGFLLSEYGLAMRATGANPRMARAQGIATGQTVYVGMALSNALVALAGALFAQTNGFADITIGTGTIVVGLAAVIVGETILPARRIWLVVLACVLGSILYRLAVAFALNADVLGLEASDLNLVTAVLVGLALILPGARNPVKALVVRRARA